MVLLACSFLRSLELRWSAQAMRSSAEMDQPILKRAATSRLSGEWNDVDYEVLADGIAVGRIMKTAAAPLASGEA